MINLVAWIINIQATEYFVSQADGDDSYTGQSPTYQHGNEGPWFTIAHAFKSVKPGDVISILNGEYREGISANGKSGAPGQYITIQNYPGHQPIVNGALDYSGTDKWTHYQGEIYYTTDFLCVKNELTTAFMDSAITLQVVGGADQLQ